MSWFYEIRSSTNTGVSYDSNGNNTADGAYSYTYDAENRIRSANVSGTYYCYLYDGDGLRVEKATASSNACSSLTVTELYWRSISGDTIAETDGSASTSNSAYNEYVFFAGQRIAQSNPYSSAVYYYFVDHLGSARVVTDASGSACYQTDYLPYGQENTPAGVTNTCSTNYKFTGYERDSETGLDYAFARYYNPRMGRFQQGDPLAGDTSDPQTLNKYAYVRNNPLNLIDPSGLDGACPYGNGYCVGNGPPIDPIDPGYCAPDDPSCGGLGSCTEVSCPSGSSDPGCVYPICGQLQVVQPPPPPPPPPSPSLISSLFSRIATSLCSVVPDAVTAGVGGDMGLGITFGIQGGIVANGSSGEVSLFTTGTTSIGFIGPDVYGALGIVSKAPTNSSLNSNGQPSAGVAGGYGRFGFQATSNSFQGTAGPSLLPITAAYQASLTNVSKSVPYLGYLLNPPRAICKAVTGN